MCPNIEMADSHEPHVLSMGSSNFGSTKELARKSIGVWRGVSKGVEDGRRPSALWAGHP
jgi:hypothetical protein